MKRRMVMASFVLIALALALFTGGCREGDNPQASPNTPSSGGLVDAPKEWDGKTVTFTGEAVGEAMIRGDKAWIHLNDDAYYLKNVEEGAHLGGYNSGMAVWLDAQQARQIEFFGDYKHEGDVVMIKGTFNAACGEHGGDMDIHATSLQIVKRGRPAHDPVNVGKLGIAVLLALFAGALYLVNRSWGRWGPDDQQG